MTKFLLIRHGKPDYKGVEEKGFKGHGCDLAFLSSKGIEQAKNAAENQLLNGADILISSPYTRCMQTASIISNKVNLPINGEINLHEWLPDLSFNYQTSEVVKVNYEKAINDYINNILENKEYESIYSVKMRVLNVLKKYLEYSKVIVVTHGGVMYALTHNHYKYCDIVEIEYDGKTLKK